jgi:hypothetical protein
VPVSTSGASPGRRQPRPLSVDPLSGTLGPDPKIPAESASASANQHPNPY